MGAVDMVFYRCSYILRTGEECNRGCYHPKGCKVHRDSPIRIPCKECGKLTWSTYGFCEDHSGGQIIVEEIPAYKHTPIKCQQLSAVVSSKKNSTDTFPGVPSPKASLLDKYKNQSRLVEELNLKFDSIIAEFKKEMEALIDINAKLHARVKGLEHEKKKIDDKIEDLEDTDKYLDTEIEDIGYQSEKNDTRIVKLEQTQNTIISFFKKISLTP
nr:5276_t:CDS:2 [Entrophospora candida]